MPPDRGGSRAEALTRHPPAYSLALRLRDAHLPPGLIAECLVVEPEAVGPMLALADAKLAALLCSDTGPAPVRRTPSSSRRGSRRR